jgi:hypothetical protein
VDTVGPEPTTAFSTVVPIDDEDSRLVGLLQVEAV